MKIGAAIDPHLWISPSGAILEAENIAKALEAADPAGAAVYKKNLAAFASGIKAASDVFRKAAAGSKNRTFVTGHAAFGYLCRDFGLKQVSVENVYAEGEPSARQLAELVSFCRKNHVKTVFAEELASPAVSRTLARECGAKVVPIYTMESPEDKLSFTARMSQNLKHIAESFR